MFRKQSFMSLTLIACIHSVACSTSSADEDDDTESPWRCATNQDQTTCACERIPENVNVFHSGEVSLCQDYSCCLYYPDQETDYDTGYCECLHADNCAAEASSRPGASVVALCPPDATVPPVQCAAQGENCRYDYLQGKGLEGCCTGSVCRASTDGVPVCQPASEEEVAFSAECSKFARGSASHALEVVTPTLVTSAGTITLPPVMYGFLEVGPLGCVSSMNVVMDGGANCRFDVRGSVAGGAFVLDGISGQFSGCAGFTGGTGVLAGSFVLTEPQGTMTFTGAACDGHLIFESYDLAGRFDFHLAGGESNGIVLADQHLVVEGGVGGGEPNGECLP